MCHTPFRLRPLIDNLLKPLPSFPNVVFFIIMLKYSIACFYCMIFCPWICDHWSVTSSGWQCFLSCFFYFGRLGLILILKGLIINYPYQVSTSTTVIEEREVVYTSSQPDNSVQWDPLAGEALEMREEMVDEAGEPVKPVTVRFVLEESSGYMEPMLRILAVLHTVISFFCIIGYYCLKVGNYYCIIAEKKKKILEFVSIFLL